MVLLGFQLALLLYNNFLVHEIGLNVSFYLAICLVSKHFEFGGSNFCQRTGRLRRAPSLPGKGPAALGLVLLGLLSTFRAQAHRWCCSQLTAHVLVRPAKAPYFSVQS